MSKSTGRRDFAVVQRRVPAVLLALCGLATLVWLFGSHQDSSRESGLSAPHAASREAAGEAQTTRAGSHPPTPDALVESREAQQPVVLEGRVLTTSGEPISGAVVTWTAWTSQDGEWEPAWQLDDWGRLEREELQATSDALGRFRFERPIDDSGGSVLWATSAGHVASCSLQQLDAATRPESILIELESGAAMRVRVEDTSGVPLSGVRVEQFGLAPARASRGQDGRTQERARRLLRREAWTDDTGTVLLGAFPGEQILVASGAGQRSKPWRGPARPEVTLRLLPGFTIQGTASLPDWSHLDYEGEQRLVVEVGARTTREVLASLRPIGNGEWGPVELPLIENARYSLHLEGSPIISVHREFTAPSPGARLNFDLVAELGHSLWFLAQNEEGETLFDAEVESHYVHEGRERVLRRRARDDGFLNPWSFPADVVVRSIVSAPGYASSWAGDVPVPEAKPGTNLVVLGRSTGLRGRVTRAGEAVPDFEVVVWRPPRGRFTQVAYGFRGREDGTFEIDDAPLGNIAIAASSETHPQCPPVFLSGPSERMLELELPEVLVGSGQVVDLATNEPVSAAEVQIFATGSEGPLRPWGEPTRTDRDGRFECAGFAAGSNAIRIQAVGFSPRIVTAAARPEQELDFGRIGLFRPQTLEVRLLADDPLDFTAFSANAPGSSGEISLPTRRFDADGFVRYENVDPGRCDLLIGRPDSSLASVTFHLESGKPWTFTHRIDGGRSLDVEVVAPEGYDFSQPSALEVAYVNSEGIHIELVFPMPRDGRMSMEGIDADSATVGVGGSMGVEVNAIAELTASGRLFARLDLGAEEFMLRIVDPEGVPLPGVIVRVSDSRPTPLFFRKSTGADGTCSFRGLPAREVLVHLEHERFGRAYNQRVDASAAGAELVLAADAALELVLRDGSEPATGVLAKTLLTRLGPLWTTLGFSDHEGRVSAAGFAPGTYSVTTDHPDYWPRTVEVQAARGAAPVEVQVRRRGAVLFQLRTPEGIPISGATLELVSQEFQADVRTWLEQGEVSGSVGLVSDLKGEVRVERLPRGPYTWRMRASDGSVLEETCQVPPRGLFTLLLVVP